MLVIRLLSIKHMHVIDIGVYEVQIGKNSSTCFEKRCKALRLFVQVLSFD